MESSIRTSRVGRKPVAIPAGIEVKFQNQELTVKGTKGQLSLAIHRFIQLQIEKHEISISLAEHDTKITGAEKPLVSAIAGTTRAKIFNMIQGVSAGFEKKLSLVGVGYRAQSKGSVLALSLGFSHPTEYHLPKGVLAETPTPTEIILKGADKELVGLAAADIRRFRPVEPYKGKGVRYATEKVELKETKKK